MAITPWRKVGQSKILASGFGKSFTKQRFLDHRGKETNFFFFEQPAWSVILPITQDGNVVLIRQFKQGAEIALNEIPGGTANFKGENPEVVVKRELLEETGYSAAHVRALGSGWMNSRNSHVRFFCFLAKDCTKIKAPHPDASEEMELYEVPLREWMREALKGELVQWDACLVALRALPYLLSDFSWDDVVGRL